MPQFTTTSVDGTGVADEPWEYIVEDFATATWQLMEELDRFPKDWAKEVIREWLKQAFSYVYNGGEPEHAVNKSEVQVSKMDGHWTYTFRYDGRV